MQQTQSPARRAAAMRREVRALLIELKAQIGDEYRAPGCEDESTPSIQITIGAGAGLESWNYQTGDNSYSGGAYGFPFWGVVTLDRRSNCADLAADAVDQIIDQIGK